MSDTFTCGRRVENGMDRDDSPLRHSGTNLDSYDARHGLVGQPRGCTYCGSMPPEDFLEALRTGVGRPSGTDKSYKFYVHDLPLAEPILRCRSTSNHAQNGYRQWNQLTKAERKAVKDGGLGKSKSTWYGLFSTETSYEAKFYTQHFSREQGWEFAEMRKAGTIDWAYAPYVRLYIPGPSNPCECPEGMVETMPETGMLRCTTCLGRIENPGAAQ